MRMFLLIFSLFSSLSLASEGTVPSTDENFDQCIKKSDVLKEKLLEMCHHHQNPSCQDRVEKLWQSLFESCVRNAASAETKEKYLLNR